MIISKKSKSIVGREIFLLLSTIPINGRQGSMPVTFKSLYHEFYSNMNRNNPKSISEDLEKSFEDLLQVKIDFVISKRAIYEASRRLALGLKRLVHVDIVLQDRLAAVESLDFTDLIPCEEANQVLNLQLLGDNEFIKASKCTGKVKYSNETGQEIKKAMTIALNKGIKVKPYFCNICESYHLGSNKLNSPKYTRSVSCG